MSIDAGSMAWDFNSSRRLCVICAFKGGGGEGEERLRRGGGGRERGREGGRERTRQRDEKKR